MADKLKNWLQPKNTTPPPKTFGIDAPPSTVSSGPIATPAPVQSSPPPQGISTSDEQREWAKSGSADAETHALRTSGPYETSIDAVGNTISSPAGTQPSTPPPPRETAIAHTPMQSTPIDSLPPVRTTESGTEFEDILDQQILADATGESTEVSAARERVDREKILNLNNAMSSAHERAVRAGFRPGTQQYDDIIRSARSDADRRNIEAENQLNAFARETRMGSRADLAAVSEREYGRLQDSEDKFDDYLKYLPSDKAQQMAVVNKMTGGDVGSFFANMYDSSGNIKPEFSDPTQTQKALGSLNEIFAEMPNNPDTGESWNNEERKAYSANLYAEMQKQVLAPVGTEEKRATELTASESRASDFVTSGDPSKMQATDWTNLTPTQIQTAKDSGKIIEWDEYKTDNAGDDWSYRQNRSTSKAEEYWLENNPISNAENKGKVIEKDGQMYIITDPMYNAKGSDMGDTWRQIQVKGRPVGGGSEITLYQSSQYEP